MQQNLHIVSIVAASILAAVPTISFAQAAGDVQQTKVEVKTAGTLSTLIDASQKYEITSLAVSGDLNGDDILFLREMAGRDLKGDATEGKLAVLDLSDANIVAGGGYYFEQNQWNKAATADATIGTHFFEKSTLVELTLPKSTVSIKGDAFTGAASLKHINIPQTVTEVGDNAFNGCVALETFTFPNVAKVCGSVLVGCKSLTKVYLPETVTSVAYGPFSGCVNLTEIHCAAKSVPAVEYMPFAGLDVKKCTLYVPEGAVAAYRADANWGQFTNIEEDAASEPVSPVLNIELTEAGTLSSFINDTQKLTATDLTVSGPINSDDIRLIREMAGRDKIGGETEGKLVHLDLSGATIVEGGDPYANMYNNDWVTKDNIMTQYMFDHSKLESIVFPKTITAIEAAFGDCYYLTGTVTIPDNVTRIGNYAFSACTQVEHFVLPQKLTDGSGYTEKALGTHAFESCRMLKDIVIPEGVTRLQNSFSYCDELADVSIPSTVTYIDGSAFGGCKKITDIRVNRKTPMSVGYAAFDESLYETCTVHVPKGCADAYRESSGWMDFKNIVDDIDISTSINGITAGAAVTADGVYTIGGIKVSADRMGKGIYVVVKNGKAQKLVNK